MNDIKETQNFEKGAISLHIFCNNVFQFVKGITNQMMMMLLWGSRC